MKLGVLVACWSICLAVAFCDNACDESKWDDEQLNDGFALLQSGTTVKRSGKVVKPKGQPNSQKSEDVGARIREFAFEHFHISLSQTPANSKTEVTQLQVPATVMTINYVPAALLSLLMVGAVSPILFREGLTPFLVVVGYLASLTLVKAFVKDAMNEGYSYSNTITVIHMFFTAVVSGAIDRPLLSEALGSFPIAVVVGLGIALNNAALTCTGVAFATMLGTCTPAMTFIVELVSGRRKEIQFQTVFSLCLVISGSLCCVHGASSYTIPGIFLILAAIFCRSMKSIWQQDLLKIDMPPLHLVFWTSAWAVLYLLPIQLFTEGLEPWRAIPKLATPVMISLGASIVCACALNILQCYAVKQLGSLMQNIVGNLNLVLVIAISATFLGEAVTTWQYAGVGFMACGVSLFKAKLDFVFSKNALLSAESSVESEPKKEANEKTAEKVDKVESS